MKNNTIAQFLKRLAKSKQGALLLDYDGTLAPFKKKRATAFMHPQIAKSLKALLKTSTRIIIISGRAIDDLIPLLRIPLKPEIWGSHGLERRKDGKYTKEKISSMQRKGLEHILCAAHSILPASHIEEKPFSIAAHLRGMAPRKKGRILTMLQTAWGAIAPNYGLELHPFKEGVEVRVPGKNKGVAIHAILSELPKRLPVAYLGDDITDDDAFKALGKRGLKISVGRYISQHADARCASFKSIILFFNKWLQAIQEGKK